MTTTILPDPEPDTIPAGIPATTAIPAPPTESYPGDLGSRAIALLNRIGVPSWAVEVDRLTYAATPANSRHILTRPGSAEWVYLAWTDKPARRPLPPWDVALHGSLVKVGIR